MGIQIPFMATDGDGSQKPPPSRLVSRLPWHRWPVLTMLLLGLVGWFLVYYATAWGPWAFSDAAGYVTAARNLVAGDGIGSFKPNGEFSPTTSHPPLYVLTIGLVSQLGFEPLEAARVTDVVLFGLLVSVSGLMVSRLLDSPWPGAAVAVPWRGLCADRRNCHADLGRPELGGSTPPSHGLCRRGRDSGGGIRALGTLPP